MNSTVYFSAFDPRYSRELWKSNLIQAGTARFQAIIAGATSSGLTDPRRDQ
jgi:ELWxxDGT repeat protein